MIHNISHSDHAQETTASLVRRLREATKGVRYDTMIGIGISGALVIPAVGRATRKQWALIRKDGEYSHAGNNHFEGAIGERFIIVDDFISSGATVGVILEKVAKIASCEGVMRPHFVGVWQYSRSSNNGWTAAANISGSAVRAYNDVNRDVPKPRPCWCGCGNMVMS
jgi:orotate phosphoribosyltransferase